MNIIKTRTAAAPVYSDGGDRWRGTGWAVTAGAVSAAVREPDDDGCADETEIDRAATRTSAVLPTCVQLLYSALP